MKTHGGNLNSILLSGRSQSEKLLLLFILLCDILGNDKTMEMTKEDL